MIIRTEQLRHFTHAKWAQLFPSLQEILRNTPAGAVIDLPARINSAIIKAAAYGFRTDNDVCGYFGLIGQYGWDFEDKCANAWMADTLADPFFTSASDKLAYLIERCIARESISAANSGIAKELGLDWLAAGNEPLAEKMTSSGEIEHPDATADVPLHRF